LRAATNNNERAKSIRFDCTESRSRGRRRGKEKDEKVREEVGREGWKVEGSWGGEG
jgi:hypothetical protein